MKVSLFDGALPSPHQPEGKRFFQPLAIPNKGNTNIYITNYRTHLLLGRLILEKCQETAEAIIDHSYKKFDAMVMNHGCQVTALQNHRLLKKKKLVDEARKVHAFVIRQLARNEDFLRNSSSKSGEYAEKRKLGINAPDYLKACDCDVEISPALAQLVRFRILHSINGLEQEDTEDLSRQQLQKKQSEEPFTCFDPLERRLNQICREHQFAVPRKPCVNIKSWIHCLQIQEAQEAVRFIRSVAEESSLRIQKLLNDSLAGSSEGVHGERLPQLYTGEAAINGVEGIVLIKNKLKFGGTPRADAEDIRVFVKVPEGRILSNHEADLLSDDTPIVVLEGYVLTDEYAFRAKIEKLGVAALLKATLALSDVAPHESYTLNTKINVLTEELLTEFVAKDEEFDFDTIREALEVVKFDHMYCNSMKEERPAHTVERMGSAPRLNTEELKDALITYCKGQN